MYSEFIEINLESIEFNLLVKILILYNILSGKIRNIMIKLFKLNHCVFLMKILTLHFDTEYLCLLTISLTSKIDSFSVLSNTSNTMKIMKKIKEVY